MATPSVIPHVEALLRAEHGDPFAVLGPHGVTGPDGTSATAIRGLFPGARAAWAVVEPEGRAVPMEVVHPHGVFEAVVEDDGKPFGYRLRVEEGNGYTHEFHDPYTFGLLLGDLDLHLMREGTHLD
ncbi:MAG: 1,4-alpha-glucan branching enzyme, partial [Planctomycetes bacterium]|nr:1,4-alpha-glucan branching enzyme [Planctomycetota bacterium]